MVDDNSGWEKPYSASIANDILTIPTLDQKNKHYNVLQQMENNVYYTFGF